MDTFPNFGDDRQTGFCAYCGRGGVMTVDHTPSKVLLDEPYPPDLPVVPACQACNQGISLDEEYVACLVECVLTGLTESEGIQRKKVRRILERKPALVAKFRQAHQESEKGNYFKIEEERVTKVILKLARGHAAFDLNEPQLDDPSNVAFAPLSSLGAKDRDEFETPPSSSLWPEVGSRAMQRLENNDSWQAAWVVVEPGRYRYLVSSGERVFVRMVIAEYLACEVVWNPI